MRVLALSGSRNPQGQTARAINTILNGVSKAGGDSECIFLPLQNLERCRQCDSDGWGPCRDEHYCVIEDDFPTIAEKVESADVLVIATPVYFGDLSESMRGFLDRYRRTHFVLGSTAERTPAIGLCYAGGSGNGTISCCTYLERILQMCGLDVVDMIPARRQNLEVKLPMLEMVGQWLATKPTSGPPFRPPPR
jgi:multimeric flavodoxin WrbA